MLAPPRPPSRFGADVAEITAGADDRTHEGRVTFAVVRINGRSRLSSRIETMSRPLRNLALGPRLVFRAVSLVLDRCLDD